MAEKFIIEGGKDLEGEVEIRGSKNAAGALIAATLLTKEECVLDNIPLVSDILNLLSILKEMGAKIEWLGERQVRVSTEEIDPEKIDFKKVSKSRVSVLLIGPLLTRFKKFKISRPGGDRIGLRPINVHLNAFQKLGVVVKEEGDFYYFKRENLTGGEVILPEFSVTATENLVMLASSLREPVIIKLAACEPQVQDLIEMLRKMGAKIQWLQPHTLKIEGREQLKGVEHKVIPDPIEAGTFLTIGAAVGKRVLVRNIHPSHLDSFLLKLEDIGVQFTKNKDSIEVRKGENLKPARIQALPYPGFPTDLLPLVVPLLTQAEGRSLIHDPLYENRLNYVHQLRKMGGDIEIVDPHRAFIFGKSSLRGVTIESWDIRAGAALVVAALIAEGKTVLENIEQIDRGYEKIEERLQKLGAEIKRESA